MTRRRFQGSPLDLTIELKRKGDVLSRKFWLPDRPDSPFESTTSWASLGSGFEFDGKRGLEAMGQLLDRGIRSELDHKFSKGGLVKAGEILFEVLLGTERDWHPPLRSLFGLASTVEPSIDHDGVRLRILTQDPLLAGLPWRATSTRGRWLMELVKGEIGWTFEVVVGKEPKHREVTLPETPRILVVAPLDQDNPQYRLRHLEALDEALDAISPRYSGNHSEDYLRRVTDHAHLKSTLQAWQPEVLYFFGHGTLDGDQFCLVLDSGRVPVADLRHDFRSRPPRIVYLNCCMSGAGGWQSAGNQLSPEVPFVLVNRTTAWSVPTSRAAIHWFRRCFRDGLGPLEALHETPDGASTKLFDWNLSSAWTSYDAWVHELPMQTSAGRLDRDSPLAGGYHHVHQLLRDPERRVQAFVVFGGVQDCVGRFSADLSEYFRDHGLRHRWLTRPEPESGSVAFTWMDLEGDLKTWLHSDNSTDDLFTRIKFNTPRLPGGMLGLVWGVFGEPRQRKIDEQQLGSWLEFCRQRLAQDLPEPLRLVCYLALEVEEANRDAVAALMNELETELADDKFRCVALPPLEDVEFKDVVHYLRDFTRCPPSQISRAAKAIMRKTGGRYGDTMYWIDLGEKEGWSSVFSKLEPDGVSSRPTSRRVF